MLKIKRKNKSLQVILALSVGFSAGVSNIHSVFAASDSNPVGYFGEMQVEGNKINGSKTGEPMQVKGMSFFWSNWATYYNSETVDRMVDEFQVEILRASYGVDDNGNPYDSDEEKIRTVVEAAIDRGVYIIIDWHTHGAHNNVNAAKGFFARMAMDYGNYDNVIFEIYNEPTYVSWSVVKDYAEGVISEIRKHSDNLVVVGSPTWSQDVGAAANDRINDKNVAYSLHFYAGTHFSSLRDKADYALSQGVALFVTEWGSVNADGNGSINYDSTGDWLAWMDENEISWANWSINDKAESSSIFNSDGSVTETGSFLKSIFESAVPGRIWDDTGIDGDTIGDDDVDSGNEGAGNTGNANGEEGGEADNGSGGAIDSENDNVDLVSGSSVGFSKASDWGTGFNGSFTINNTGSSDIEDWVLEFDFDGQINSFWTAQIVSHSGNHYMVKPHDWNSTVNAGKSLDLGFTATGGQTVTNITLGGNSDVGQSTGNANEGDTVVGASSLVPIVEFSVSKDWGTGFNGEFTIKNTGSTDLSGWTLEFDYDGQIDSFWTAKIISHSEGHYVVKPLDWNSTIKPGDSLKLGFTATGSKNVSNSALK
ncbi:cellulase family glycosylhydrolase [Microbulbifer sp. CnH-101-G]|uniref:cellulase family glycosylhydrolase n=1 Tax=Microbulbifer sp. CnH-101-G TaxID=3243393 RepID=UPI004039780D